MGLAPALSLDIDPILTYSFQRNFPRSILRLADLSAVDGSDIERTIGARVDGVIGGPPCQGFSEMGRRAPADPRRSLLGDFFRIVVQLSPAFFVLENVRGLNHAYARYVLDAGIELLRGRYCLIGPIVWDAADFGAATKRPRLFLVGVDKSRVSSLSVEDFNSLKAPPATVKSAIHDLMSVKSVGDDSGFDLWKICSRGRPSEYAARLRNAEKLFTGNRKTIHGPATSARFEALRPGETDPVGRHPRLSWDGQCPTLRAGTGSDRGSHQAVRPIHPQIDRVITVREAARLQGFPDSFRFHPTIWHSFRMIGNSVSPIIARAILFQIAKRFMDLDSVTKTAK